MSRIIKFRAWSEEYKEMIACKDLTFEDGEWTAVWRVPTEDGTAVDENPTIMQFTGLLDENGTDSYGDDIVNSSNIFVQNTNLRIVYVNGRFCGSYEHKEKGFIGVDLSTNSFKIIGNFHQNPELMEKQ